jgi:phospholipase/carboxylesterase
MIQVPDSLGNRVRQPDGKAQGAIVLLHGRGADEHDLFPLFDLIDPSRARVGVTLRGPLSLPPGGAHWYELAGIPTPETDTFMSSYEQLVRWLRDFYATTGFGPGDTVIGGFSQGCVMAHALTFAADGDRTAGLLAFSGFMPEVDALELAPEEKAGLRVAIGHGTADSVIPVDWSRRARVTLQTAGLDVYYRESPMEHSIDPSFARDAGHHVMDDEELIV